MAANPHSTDRRGAPLAAAGLSAALVLAASSARVPPAAVAGLALALGLLLWLRPALPSPAAPAPGRGRGRAWAPALLLWALAAVFWRLGGRPAGPGFVESAMAVTAEGLRGRPYTPHVTDFQVAFPTLLFYQGLAAARWLGWNLAALRAPAALWGALSVPALYVLLRAWAPPSTAAAFALLYSVNNLFLCESRLFFPGSVVWAGSLASAAFLTLGLRSGGRGHFLAAGLFAGLCLHGYLPGRAVPPLLLLWLLSARLPGAEGPRASAGQLLLFVLGCLLSGAPVILWAAAHPVVYWLRPSNLGGGAPVLRHLLSVLPDYGAFLYGRPDGILLPTDGLPLFPLLRPDPLTALLVPVGLWACLWAWRRPGARLILLGLAVGLLPAALPVDTPHPNSRRALLALPWLYAAGAWAWEGLRARAPAALQGRLRGLLAGGVVLGAALSLHQYFVEIMDSPAVREAFYDTASALGAERRAHPGARTRASIGLVLPRTHRLVFPDDTRYRILTRYPNFIVLDPADGPPPEAVKQFGDFLLPQPAGPRLMLLAPYLASAAPLLEALFPGGRSTLHAEALPPGFPVGRWDDCAPFVKLLSFSAGPGEAEAFSGLVDLGRQPYVPGSRLAAWDKGFGAAQRGRRLDLGGAWLSGAGPARVELAWPRWRVSVDGAPLGPGESRPLAAGVHRLRLRGPVPAAAAGALPLVLIQAGKRLDPAGRVVPVDPRFGFEATWGAAPGSRRRRWELLPLHRYLPPEGEDGPHRLAWRGRLRVPVDGRYRFRLAPSFRAALRIGAASAPPGSVEGLVLDLRAATPVDVSLVGTFRSDTEEAQTAYLLVQDAHSGGWRPLPYDWALAPDPI